MRVSDLTVTCQISRKFVESAGRARTRVALLRAPRASAPLMEDCFAIVATLVAVVMPTAIVLVYAVLIAEPPSTRLCSAPLLPYANIHRAINSY